MRCVVIPSLVGEGRSDYPAPDPSASQGVVEIIPSLLAFQPELYGLPAFTDTIQGVIPMVSGDRGKG
jgi:riboflavin kinase